MCNCRKAATVVEKYGESVAARSDSLIFFSKVIDSVVVGLIIAVFLPLVLCYWAVMSVLGKRAVFKLPKNMERGIKLALEQDGETI